MFSYIKSFYVSDVRAQYGRFKEILFLPSTFANFSRGVQRRTYCLPPSLAISRAMSRACDVISCSLSPSPLSLSLYGPMQINSQEIVATCGMSASSARNKITSLDNMRHFILSVLSRRADKASHKFFNTSDLKINRVPGRM